MAKLSRAVAELRRDVRLALARIATLISGIRNVEDQDRALAALAAMSDHLDDRDALERTVRAFEELLTLSDQDRARVTQILSDSEALVELQQETVWPMAN